MIVFYFFITCLVILTIFFCLYSILPTLIIRNFKLGIIKNTNAAGIALTFDDGPNPKYTPQLLDLLKKYGVKASFFVVGSKVEKYPEIMERMSKEGHTIGIHHFKHLSSWVLSPLHLRKQLIKTEKVIEKYSHQTVHFYRPPWGHFNIFTLLLSRKYQIVMWSNIFGDWKVQNCKKSLLDNLRASPRENSILLLHDCGITMGADEEAPAFMMKKLEVFLKECQKNKTQFITLKDLNLQEQK